LHPFLPFLFFSFLSSDPQKRKEKKKKKDMPKSSELRESGWRKKKRFNQFRSTLEQPTNHPCIPIPIPILAWVFTLFFLPAFPPVFSELSFALKRKKEKKKRNNRTNQNKRRKKGKKGERKRRKKEKKGRG